MVRSQYSGGAAMEAADGNALAMVVSASAGGGSAGGAAGGSKEPAGLPCPRCESTDTKFCYYNNYNLGQPRHFCKGCRRYWTRGGALRNVPVGGGTRKPSSSLAAARRNKRAASSSSTTATATAMPLSVSAAAAYPTMAPRSYDLPQAAFMAPVRADRRLLDLGGSFTSLLAHASSSTTTATLAPPDGRFSAGRFLLGGGLHQAPAGMMMPTPASPAPALLQQPDCMPPPHQPMMPQASAFPEGFVWGMGWPDLSI